MRSRVLPFVALLVMLSSVTAFAAQEVLPQLPVYPGGKVVFELNLTEKDFLPAIRQFIATAPSFVEIMTTKTPTHAETPEGAEAPEQGETPVFPPPMDPAMLAKMSEEMATDLQEALKGLKQVSVAYYQVGPAVKPGQIADFYMQKLGLSKGWQSVLRVEDKWVVRVYAKPDLEGLFGFASGEGKAIAVRTNGKIDVTLLSKLGMKYGPMLATMRQQMPKPSPPQTEETQPAGPEQPAEPEEPSPELEPEESQ